MSYQVIARKWRPQAFEEVTGQEHVTQTLRNAIEFERLHHAYLFSGARGVGKTTTARLLAKALNCNRTDKPTVTPCRSDTADACPSCVEISESRSIDVLEFDAASNTQVDKIRDIILESIYVRAARDRYKVFIIDEVHMLSASSFNALLKTLEEPPPNVVFIMATTEYHKLPETITSRCQEFRFRTISKQKIAERLRLIADTDAVKIEAAALDEIARSGEGSMRDAQSNFDQVISFSGETITADDVFAALGMAGTDTLVRTIRSIADREPKLALQVVDELVSGGYDLRVFCRDLLSLVRDLMVSKLTSDDDGLLDLSIVSTEVLRRLAEPFSASDLVRLFNAVADTETRLKDTTQSRYTLELGLVKMAEMRRLVALEALLDRLGDPTGTPGPPNAASPAAAAATSLTAPPTGNLEKKTPAADPLAIKRDDEVEDVDDEPDRSSYRLEEEPPYFQERPGSYDNVDVVPPPFLDDHSLDELPTKLEPLTDAELEHVIDEKLDDRFESALMRSGDDLSPITGASSLVTGLLGRTLTGSISAAAGSSGAAAAPARDLSRFAPPIVEEDEGPVEHVVLSENPTEEELRAFARSLPSVRRLMRLFKAEIVEVKRT